jgi:hypothetical protein
MKKHTSFSSIVANIKYRLASVITIMTCINSYAQTNPTAQMLPVSQTFGTATFTSLPAGFSGWTSGSSPSGTQASAEGSSANGDASISVATGTQSTGGLYGYATGSDASPYIQTSSNATNGTNQLAAAISTTGYGNIAVSYDVKMISANPRTIGVELQYRVGTSGSWTSVSGTVYSHTSSDRSNGNVDNFSSTLPTGADNDSVIQLRWITWRGSQTGNSSGIAIDNISITATALQTYYFRSKQSGNWNSSSTWEYSPNNSTWTNASLAPRYTANTVTIQSADSVSITNSDTLDQIVINGILKYEDLAVTPVINNGTGADLTINGKFYDAGPNSITWLSSATWSMGSNGYLIRNRSTSATNWRDKYDGGISTIPATAYWIVRKNTSDSPLLSSTGGMYYPNLTIENYTGSGWTTGTNSSFSGSSSSPVVKGSLSVGGNGSNTVSFLNSNTNASPVLVYGNLSLKSSSTLRCQGTGYEVQGDLALNGTVDYTGGSAFLIKLSGSANQNLSGTLTLNNLELHKTTALATVTLQSPATITSSLSFVKGYLVTDTTNLLTFAHHSSAGNAAGNNTNDSAFVKGPVKKIGNSAFTFPVGKGNNYQPVSISAPSDSTAAYMAEYFNTGQTLGGSKDSTIDSVSTCEYWKLNNVGTVYPVFVTLGWDNHSCNISLGVTPAMSLVEWNGTLWANLGNKAAPSGTVASFAPVNSFGIFTLAQQPLAGCVLTASGYSGPTPQPASVGTCDNTNSNTNTDYTDKYKKIETYIPDSNTPIKHINIAVNIFTGTGTMQNTASTIAAVNQMVAWLNGFYTNLDSASYHIPGVPTPTDTKIRFDLDDRIFFYEGTSLHHNTDIATLQNYEASIDSNRLNYLNIYITIGGGSPYSIAPYPKLILGSAGAPTTSSLYDDQGIYISSTNASYVNAQTLAHELGHYLDLFHTYEPSCCHETCDASDPEYLYDLFGNSPPTNCWEIGGFGCTITPGQNFCTNDIMGGNNMLYYYFSPMQIGKMHRALSIKSSRRYVKESPYNSVPLNITTNETWDFDIRWYSDIVVKSGATLTIKCKVLMADQAKISVERGGTLIIDGGTITSAYRMWRGIEVWGDITKSQLPTGGTQHQGKVILKNSALIENAHEGITTIKTDTAGNWDWGYTGGIIQAENSTFSNCRRDVQYLSYHNFNPTTSASMNNIGYFKNCTFETTGQLKDPAADLETHVTLYDVRGVRFLGNTFSNSAPDGVNGGIIESGIGSIDASYTVADLCMSLLFPCTTLKSNVFENLNYGIYATNSNPMITISVNHSQFINNRYDGIHLTGLNHPVINNCSFDIGNYSQLSSGVYLENCKYYTVQNNQFFSDNGNDLNVGIWANNSGAGAHEIYNNTFTGLAAGIVPLNNNSGLTNLVDGLTMHCNTFIGDSYDIGVIGSVANDNSIAWVQGAPTGNAKDLVRNRYSATCGGQNQFYISGSNKQVIHATNSDSNTQPLPQPSCSNTLVQVVPTVIALDTAAACPDKASLTNQQRRSLIVEFQSDEGMLKASYDSLVDGGNTQQLLDDVNNAGISSTHLRDTLLSRSPYLSDTVMVAYLTKTTTPPADIIKQVIVANSPVTEKVKTVIDGLGLPSPLQEKIDSVQVGVSARQTLEAQIVQADFNGQLYTSDIMASYLTDTLIDSPADSIIQLLTDLPRPDAKKEFVLAYMYKENYDTAQSLIDSAEVLLPGNDFYELQKLIIQVNQASNKAYSLQTDSTLKASFEAFANDSSKEGSVYAQALLRLVFNTSYPELRLLPNPDLLRSMHVSSNQEPITKTATGLLIYPNPANNAVNIVFNDTSATNAIVEIRDIMGRLIERMPLKTGVPYTYDMQALGEGIYLISLYTDNKFIENKKLILIK